MKLVKFGVSGHFLENLLSKWPEILHADVFWPPSKLFRLWLQFVDFFLILMLFWLSETGQIWGFHSILVMLCGYSSLWWPFGWNWSYLGFLGIIWRTCGSTGKCRGGSGGIFPTLCVEFCLVWYVPNIWISFVRSVLKLRNLKKYCVTYHLWSYWCSAVVSRESAHIHQSAPPQKKKKQQQNPPPKKNPQISICASLHIFLIMNLQMRSPYKSLNFNLKWHHGWIHKETVIVFQ